MKKVVSIWDIDGSVWWPKRVPLVVGPNLLSHPKWAISPEDYSFYPEAIAQIAQQSRAGHTIVCCTNQGGSPLNVSAGMACLRKGKPFRPYKPLRHLWQEQTFLLRNVPQIASIWWSPGKKSNLIFRRDRYSSEWHWSMEKSCCHKPSPKLLLDIQAVITAEEYHFWGDSPTDQQAAITAQSLGMPVKFHLVDWR